VTVTNIRLAGRAATFKMPMMKVAKENENHAKLEHQTNSDIVVTKCDNRVINIMQFDMRNFDFSTFLFLMNKSAISLSNEKTTKQLFKKAMHNFYARFKLFHRLHARAFILTPIFLYEIKVSNLMVVDIVSTINFFLKVAGFDPVNYEERELLRENYSSVSNALVNDAVENKYSEWLQHLFTHYHEDHALLKVVAPIERQMFSTTLTPSDEMVDMVEEVKNAASQLPNKEERDRWFDEIKTMHSSIRDKVPTASNWNTLVDNSTTLTQAFEKIANVVPEVKQGAGSIRMLTDQFLKLEQESQRALKVADSFTILAKDVAVCSLIAWSLYHYDTSRTMSSFVMMAVSATAGVYICQTKEARAFLVGSGVFAIWHLIRESHAWTHYEVEKQSGLLDVSSTLSALTTFLTSIKWSSLPRKILDIIRLCKELPDFIMQVFELLKGFANSIWLTFYKTPLFSAKGDFNEGYLENVKHIFSAYTNDDLQYTFDEAQLVDSLIEQTKHYMNECKKFGDRKLLDSNFKVLRDIQRDLSDLRYSKGGSRQEPVVILLEGVPGTKKTVWQRNIAVALVKMFKQHVTDQSREIYVKPAGDYWSMYKNQFVCCFDDFGQVRDSLGDPREKGDLINMYNTAPFPLNMNENEDKGKTFFTSEFIIMTANEGWSTSPSIISEEALKRRVDLRISVIRDVKNPPVNDTGIEVLIPENYSFNVYPIGGEPRNNQTFQDVLDLAAAKYKIKQKHYQVFQRVQKDVIGEVKMSQNVEEELEAKLKEVEEKISSTIDNYRIFNTNQVQRQSSDEKTEVDIQMQFLDEFNQMLDEKIKIHADLAEIDRVIPKCKIRIPAMRDERKVYNDQAFQCQFYPDVEEMEFEAAKKIIAAYTHIEEPDKSIIPRQDLAFLELHYGINRTHLFLTELQWARSMFGLPKDEPLREYVNGISRKTRGYYFTVISVLMCIWMQDRQAFFYCHVDSTFCLKELVQMRGFEDVIPLSDWRLALKRANKSVRNFFTENFQPLTDVVTRIEDSISDKIITYLGVGSFSRDDVKRFVRYATGVMSLVAVVSPMLGVLVPYFMKRKEGQEQSSQPFFKTDKAPPKTSLKEAIRSAAISRQSSSVMPVVTKLESSAAILSISTGTLNHTLGKVFFLDTGMFIIPLHFYQDILELDNFKVIIDDGDIKTELEKEDMFGEVAVVETAQLEFVIVKSPKLKKTRRNVLENFVTRDQIAKFPGEFTIAIRPYTEKSTMMSSAHIGSFKYSGKTVDKMIKYQVNTGKGDCGSMIYAMLPTLGSSIICGIHDAGTPKGCTAVMASAYIITREDIIEACEQFSDASSFVEVQGNPCQAAFSHSPYGVSRIVPSPLFSLVREATEYPTKFPAKLLPNKETGQDPLKIGLAKYKDYPKNFCEKTLDFAVADLIDEFLEFPYYIRYGSRVPYKESFYGDPMCEQMRSIPTSTSGGYPYKFTDRTVKQRLKEEGPDGPTYAKETSRLEETVLKLRTGKRPEFVYTLNLKDEIRFWQKVQEFSTRIFLGTPYDLCWLKKSFFGEFMIFMQVDCIQKGTAMAVNPHSTDWKRIMQRLSELVPSYDYAVCQDFDYAHFDGSNSKLLMQQVVHVINSWYAHHGIDQDNDIREMLFREVYNFKYINQTEIVEMNSSLPSGSYLTLLINCITNRILLRYAFYRKFPGLRYRDHVRDIVLGDDNVVSIHPELVNAWSPVDIANSVSELGFEITLGDKTVVTNSWSSLHNVTFLKRKFTVDSLGIVRAPLDKETMWNTICYSKKGILYRQIFADNIQFFYREMSQHGKATYLHETGRLRRLLQQIPDCNHYPLGIPKEWLYLDKLVRHSPFFAPSEM
jgi:hypothetical protein